MNIKKTSALTLLVILLAMQAFAQNGSNVAYPAVPVEINDTQQTGANDTGSRERLGEAEFNRSEEIYQGIQSSLNATTPEGETEIGEGETEIAAGSAGAGNETATENATAPSTNATPGFNIAFALTGILAAAGFLVSRKFKY